MHDDYFMFLLEDIDGATKTYTQYSMLLQQLYFTNYIRENLKLKGKN